MGLTLIHGNTQPSAKPRIFVVAEPSVHNALQGDLELDVYPECFDYDSFVKASLSKSIATNNAIIIVSDSLSQRVAPLEAVIALVRSNVILIPWKSTETEIGQLNVASCSPRPTANTLRRAIFAHSGMQDLPPRFDGDEYIEEPPDAGIVSFSSRTQTPADIQFKPMVQAPPPTQSQPQTPEEQVSNQATIDVNKSTSPLEWFAGPTTSTPLAPLIPAKPEQSIQQETPVQPETLNQTTPPASNVVAEQVTPQQTEFLPPIEQQRLEEEAKLKEQQALEEQAKALERTVSAQEDAPSFLPEFFSAQTPPTQTPEVQEKVPQGNINAFWNDEIAPVLNSETRTDDSVQPQKQNSITTDQAKLAETEKWISQAFSSPQNDTQTQPEAQNQATTNTSMGSWATTDTTSNVDQSYNQNLAHPYSQGDSLELEAYVSNDADLNAYDIEDSSPVSFTPEVAFRPSDKNGSQQMWTMFDSNMEPAGAQTNSSLSEFPDGTDNRKAIHLAEPLTICVYSPKGGVGKTSISVNLAARLAYTTRLQVCIVDLDIAFGNVGTRLGLYNPTVRELLNESHIDGESIARNLVYDRRSGLFALLAPLRPETGTNRRKFSPAAYKKILSILRERFDVVLLDCPVELRDPLVSGFALTEASRVVMVVNNEQATLLDARRAVEAMCRPKDSQRLPGLGIDPSTVGMVVNQKVDNVGREVEDIKAILGGGDPNHPSREIEVLSVIADDRQLWVGNANMARTIATSGENDVDKLLDGIWSKVLPGQAGNEYETQEFNPDLNNPLDEILSSNGNNSPKKKRKRNLFKKND